MGQGDKNQGAVPFFSSENKDYSNIAELYLKYEISNTKIILGRQEIDTPFAQLDDGVGLIIDRFEALTIINTDIKDTTIIISKIQKWAGVDAPNTDIFTLVNADKGMLLAGVTYEGIKNTVINAWFYNLEGLSKNYYTDINYEAENESISYGGTLQYALQKYENQIAQKYLV